MNRNLLYLSHIPVQQVWRYESASNRFSENTPANLIELIVDLASLHSQIVSSHISRHT